MPAEDTPSAASFAKLLAWLGSDPNQAAAHYEEIRRKLIRFFACRGCAEPEDLADAAIDRVNRALDRPSFQYVGDPVFYFYGVAKNVRLEYFRREARVLETPVKVDSSEQEQRNYDCLDQCLAKLAERDHKLLLDYYDYDSGGKSSRRQLLAEALGMPLNALRIRLHRLRNQLRYCVTACMQQIS
jgi:RNA polymerase sigma factor (sigma-70 family)